MSRILFLVSSDFVNYDSSFGLPFSFSGVGAVEAGEDCLHPPANVSHGRSAGER